MSAFRKWKALKPVPDVQQRIVLIPFMYSSANAYMSGNELGNFCRVADEVNPDLGGLYDMARNWLSEHYMPEVTPDPRNRPLGPIIGDYSQEAIAEAYAMIQEHLHSFTEELSHEHCVTR